MQHWKIGELAKETGLTVRTLRYYDQIGLLTPSRRMDNGYRLYNEEDIKRLQQILSLRQIGLTLDQIQSSFEEHRFSMGDVVQLQMDQLREQIDNQQQLLKRLEEIHKSIQAQQDVSVERLLKIIEVMNMIEKHGFDPGFSEEEMEQIKQRGEEYGPEKIREVEEEWPKLIAKVQAELDKGTPPSDPAVQALATRWKELIEMFTGGNPEISRKLAQAYQDTPKFGESMGMNSELMDYVQQAWSQ